MTLKEFKSLSEDFDLKSLFNQNIRTQDSDLLPGTGSASLLLSHSTELLLFSTVNISTACCSDRLVFFFLFWVLLFMVTSGVMTFPARVEVT